MFFTKRKKLAEIEREFLGSLTEESFLEYCDKLTEAGGVLDPEGIMYKAAKSATNGKVLSFESEKCLSLMSSHTGVSVPSEIRRQVILREIFEGRLPVLKGTSVALTSGELVHFETHACTIENKVTDSWYEAGSSGYNIRIAKGVSYRVGGTKGRKREKREDVKTSSGSLFLTNKRIIYSSQKGFTEKLSDLSSVERTSNGLLIVGKRPRTLFVPEADTFLKAFSLLNEKRE